MLKKTKIITNTYWIVNSTYTVSYIDRCTSCTISIDHPSGAALDTWMCKPHFVFEFCHIKSVYICAHCVCILAHILKS